MTIFADIRSAIIEKALSIGFDEAGFASYEKLTEEIGHYKGWLENGNNADMAWMEKSLDKREDPSLILPGIRTVIVLACSYYTGIQHTRPENKIARYAWGTDYHEVLPKKLRQLEEEIKILIPGSESKSYVDTGPLLERQWAERAGLGWQGKNSLILNRKLGSYFFLSVILTTADISSDERDKDRCGKCTKCLDACPTGAITAPKVVDANKCISYWTIESKEEKFPPHISQKLNGWAFGCDICQEVCPWNGRRLKPKLDDWLQPRNGETNFHAETISNYTPEEFSARFSKSPVKRPKLAGIKRNISEVEESKRK